MHPKRLANPSQQRPKCPDKDHDAYVRLAWEAGWWCERGKKNYIYCYPENDQRVVKVSSTPSENRSIRNTRAAFRRSGLDL